MALKKKYKRFMIITAKLLIQYKLLPYFRGEVKLLDIDVMSVGLEGSDNHSCKPYPLPFTEEAKEEGGVSSQLFQRG